jgi:hypothetical protein
MDRKALEDALAETLHEHGLQLDEITWRKNLKKKTLSLGLKVSGDLNEQLRLLE